MKILFCIPAYGSQVRIETAMSAASGVMHLAQNIPGSEVKMFAVDMAEIARVRNLFASLMLHEEHDALIMLDSDMGVPPDTFTRLIRSGHEVCGLTYPKREIDLQRFYNSARAGAEFEAARVGALNFIAAGAFIHNNGTIDIKDSFIEMRELPGGCLVIRRSALEKMWKAIPSIRQTEGISDVEGQMGMTKIIRCFDNIQKGNVKVSEDLSFCRRWREIGGQIHALFDVPVAHYGHMKFEGAYSAQLMAGATNIQPG